MSADELTFTATDLLSLLARNRYLEAEVARLRRGDFTEEERALFGGGHGSTQAGTESGVPGSGPAPG